MSNFILSEKYKESSSKLNKSAFPLVEDNFFRLLITGFKDRNSAEKAYKKLIAAGLQEGYIKAYKEKSIKILSGK